MENERGSESRELALKSRSLSLEERKKCSSGIVEEHLVRFAASYHHEPSPLVASIFREHLENLPASQVTFAMKRVEETFRPTQACPFPTVAHVMEFISQATAIYVAAAAEDAWQKWLALCTRYADSDIGWRGPKIPPRIDHALRAAGGISFIATCRLADLQWAKKRFVECYERDESLPEFQAALPIEARKLIVEVAKKKAVLQLPKISEGKETPVETVPARPAAAAAPARVIPPSRFGSLEEQKAELRKRGFL